MPVRSLLALSRVPVRGPAAALPLQTAIRPLRFRARDDGAAAEAGKAILGLNHP